MYGYIIASYQLRLPHTFISSIVVSDVETTRREGWAYIDQMPDEQVCATNDIPMSPSSPMPIGLHYCQRYFLGEVRIGASPCLCLQVNLLTKLTLKWPSLDS